MSFSYLYHRIIANLPSISPPSVSRSLPAINLCASPLPLPYYHQSHLSTTNSLRVLISVIPIFLLQLLNQLHISLLRLLLCDPLVDYLLPCAFLGFALSIG